MEDLMLLTMMKGKLHRAAVTACDLHREGSCSIDVGPLEAATILPHERIDIWNITNGAAARYVQTGDRVIIAAFAQMDEVEARQWAPSVVRVNGRNEIVTGIA
jgi:aspartate 1-decarboxylase